MQPAPKIWPQIWWPLLIIVAYIALCNVTWLAGPTAYEKACRNHGGVRQIVPKAFPVLAQNKAVCMDGHVKFVPR